MQHLLPDTHVRLATTLVHAIPGLRLEIDDGAGSEGPPIPSFSPCELRRAVGRALGHESPQPANQLLVDLVRSPNLTVTIRNGRSRVYGCGIVGFACYTTAVFAFCTTLSAEQVNNGMAHQARTHTVLTRSDELLGTTLVHIEVDAHHRLEPSWHETALAEIQEAMVTCMSVGIELSEAQLQQEH